MTRSLFHARRLCGDARAVAAVEFAIILPFMLLLYLGAIELGIGMAISVKVTSTTRSLTDMVTQNTQVSAAQLRTILAASTAVMAPYPTIDGSGHSLISVTVSEVATDGSGNARVQWSQSYDGITMGTGRATGQSVTLPSSLAVSQNNNISLILGEVSYAYTPNIGGPMTGTVVLRDNYYFFPRCSTNGPANSSFPYYDVKLTASTTCTCIQHVQQKIC